MHKDRLQFYLHRLRRASVREILHRARETIFLQAFKYGPEIFESWLKAPDVDQRKIERLKLPGWIRENDCIPAQKVMQGHLFCLGFPQPDIRDFEDRCRNKPSIDVRFDENDPDIRAVWEAGRLQHLTILIDGLNRGGHSEDPHRIKRFVRRSLIDWIEANPFLYGPHYMSVMECALRLPVFIYALRTLDNLSAADRQRLLRAVYEHAWLTEQRLSLYSSLGNHTTCEALGLIMAGALFDATRQGRRWLHRGTDLLQQECEHQILSDGGPAEKSLNYHRFVLDAFWLAVDFLESNGLADCRKMRRRLVAGETFLAVFNNGSGTPAIGDSDDGRVVAPGLHPAIRSTDHPKRDQGIHIFDESGCTVVHGANGEFVTFDHGPLGMAPFYNHGHADALSITAYKNGKALLVDPGTYRYNGSQPFRRWFKGTSAHNTVCIDGRDQALQLTSFIWKNDTPVVWKAQRQHTLEVVVDGELRGYGSDRQSVHRRTFYFKHDACLLVDRFEGTGVHDYELRFVLHPDVAVTRQNGWHVVENNGDRLYLWLMDGDFWCAEKEDQKAWYSFRYGQMQTTRVLICKKQGLPDRIGFKTILYFGPETTTEAVLGKFNHEDQAPSHS